MKLDYFYHAYHGLCSGNNNMNFVAYERERITILTMSEDIMGARNYLNNLLW